MSIGELSLKERAQVLHRMLDHLDKLGFPVRGPRSALNAGEDGISFITIFHVAKKNEEFSQAWAVELAEFNALFSKDPYMRHCGYPLS
jgi:hypothetical protein